VRRQLLFRNTPDEWNIKVHTLEDFYIFCAANSIIVHEDKPLERTGLYLIYEGESHIFIDSRLRGHEKTFVCLHELGHFLLHPLGIQFFTGMSSTVEYEADVVAVCAMIPRPLLRSHWPGEIVEEYGYEIELVEFRQEIFDIWRI
jgi:Zn-dependent peptidase ImmA (M78 family)